MRIVGTIESDLADAAEYQEGGIGPFFGTTRVQEALSVDELLYRFVRALERIEPVRVISMYLDDAEVYRDSETEGDEEGATLQDALKIGRDALADVEEEPTYVGLTVVHEDKQFYHVIFIEAATDHELEEAAFVVLDTAEVLDGDDATAGEDEADEEDEELALDAEPDIAPEDLQFDDEPDITGEDAEYDEPDIALQDSAAQEDALFAFLEKLQAHLGKELQLVEPEIDVWTDYTGEYEASAPSIAPGIG
jgi:hypothetical protein